MQRFEGARVLITGGSRGIGRAVAEAFAVRGARVAIAFNRNRRAADEVLAALAGAGHLALPGDLTDPGHAQSVVAQTVEAFGGLDIVVNNAGIYHFHKVAETDAADWADTWRRTLDTNLVAPAMICHAAARHMIGSGGGKIVNVSSRGAFRGEPDAPAYGASKAGLNAMSQSLAVALAPHGIFVGVVAPGFVDTDMAAASLAGPDGDAIRAQSPLGRVARPEEVANAVLFLASDDIEFATGAIIDVNGASYLRS